eukprot:5371550-Prymnesium_polylepis.2
MALQRLPPLAACARGAPFARTVRRSCVPDCGACGVPDCARRARCACAPRRRGCAAAGPRGRRPRPSRQRGAPRGGRASAAAPPTPPAALAAVGARWRAAPTP